MIVLKRLLILLNLAGLRFNRTAISHIVNDGYVISYCWIRYDITIFCVSKVGVV